MVCCGAVAMAMATVIEVPRSSSLQTKLAICLWLGPIHLVAFSIACLFCLPTTAFWTLLGLLVSLMLLPLFEDSSLSRNLAKFICKHAPSHFPITLVVEDMEAFDKNRAYVLAVEPHSILPIGTIAFCEGTGLMPLPKLKGLASNAVFFTPILRHVWSSLGLIPASKKNLLKKLRDGYSCVIIPGGVREILSMEHEREVVYLKHRYGFVRAAIETGVPLVPSFIFGQTRVYKWWKPKGNLYARLSRLIRFTPLIFWGIYGSPIPFQHPMYIAVGKPIEVEKIEQPSMEEVMEVHDKFLSAMKQLYENHKDAAGFKDIPLYVM